MNKATRNGLIAFLVALIVDPRRLRLSAIPRRRRDGGAGFDRRAVHAGRSERRDRHDTDFRGKLMLIYFGYTFCPDVCPTTLTMMSDALAKLGPDAAKIAPIFITVDPARDTPAQMKLYIEAFDPHFVALTGSDAQIAAVGGALSRLLSQGGGRRRAIHHGSFLGDLSDGARRKISRSFQSRRHRRRSGARAEKIFVSHPILPRDSIRA